MKHEKKVQNLDTLPTRFNLKPHTKRSTWGADFALVVCALLWGMGFVAMKGALDTYPAYWLLFFRFMGGTLLMGICFFKQIAKTSKEDLFGGVIIGIFLFLGMGLQTVGLDYTTAGKQAFLTATYVVMVPLLSWGLYRTFPGWIALVGAFVCFTGMGLLTSDITGPLNIGDLLTIVSTLFFAAQIISIAHYAGKGDPLVLTFVQFLVTALLSMGTALYFNGPLELKGTQGLFEVFFTTVFCTFLCFLIQNIAQKHTSSSHASILLGLESVFGVLGGIFILGESFTFRMGGGCSLIFGAILLVELGPVLLDRFEPTSLPPKSVSSGND